MKKIFFTLFFILVLCSSSYSKTIDVIEAELQNILNQKNDEMIDISIVFNSQINTAKLMTRAGRNSDMTLRREFVVSELKDFSKQTQSDVLTILKAEEKNGNVTDINSLWIVNSINCKASREVIYKLSSHPDIQVLSLNKELQLLSPEAMKETASVEATKLRGPAAHVVTVQADHVWEQGYTGKNVVVAVLDSGTNYAHADIKDNLWEGYVDTDGDGNPDSYVNGWNYIANNSDITDDFGHGSHCAGIVCGNGASGTTTGIAPDAKLMTVKTVGAVGTGSVAQMLSGVQFAVENGADILSMSLGFKNSQLSTAQKESIRDAFVNVLSSGVIVCAAAGNDGTSIGTPYNVDYPAACPPPYLHPDQTALQSGGLSSVVCVGGSDLIGSSSQGPSAWGDDTKYNDYPYDGTSTFGLIRPDISAPGNLLYSLSNIYHDKYKLNSGTSQSTPCVAGVMALMLEKNSSLTPAQIAEIIETTAVDKPATKNNVVGSGRIDALAAVNAVTEGTRAPYIRLASVTPQVLTQGSGRSIAVTLKNEGKGTSSVATTASISTSNDPYVTITIDTCDVNALSTGTSKEITFNIDIDAQTPNGHIAVFDLVITSGNYTWKDIFSVEITSTPDLAFKSVNPGIIGINEDKVITVTIANNGTADQNDATTLTLSALSNDLKYLTIVDGEATISSVPAGGTADATFTVRANESAPHNYSADLFIETVSESSATSNYTYEFESGTEGWTSFDAAGNGIATPWWYCSDAILHGKSAKDSHSGSGHLMSETVEKGLVQYTYPIDNYLVAPSKIEVTANTEISFYARAYDDYYYPEHFGLAISTTENDSEDDFTTVQEWTITKAQGASWNKYSYDLSAYAGQEVYVAIRHFFTQAEWEDYNIADYGYGVWALNIDDVVFSNVLFNTHHVPTYSYDDPYHFNIIIENSIELPAPENFTVTPNGISEIILSWDTVAKAKSYNIYRNDKYLANLTDTTYTDSGLSHNTEYCYKVAAIYNGVEGIFTDNVCVTTNQKDLSIIVKEYSPSTMYMGVNSDEITATLYNDGANSLPAHALCSLTCDDAYVTIPATTSSQITISSLTPGAELTKLFKGIVIDENIPHNRNLTFNVVLETTGTQESEEYKFTLPLSVIVKNDSWTPKNLRITDFDDKSATLEWDAVANAVGYNIYRNGSYIGSISSTLYLDNGLTPSTDYCYTVTSINEDGESDYSIESCMTTNPEDLGIMLKSYSIIGTNLGEELELVATLINKSGIETPAGTATLLCNDGNVNIVVETDDFGALAVDGETDVTFTIVLSEGTPVNHTLDFYITAKYENSGGTGSVVTTYDFEDGFQDWTTLDADKDTHTWFWSNATEDDYAVLDAHGMNYLDHLSEAGAGCLLNSSYCGKHGNALTPNDYVISPVIKATDNVTVTFKVASMGGGSYYKEHYGLAISKTNNTLETAFETIYENTLENARTWNEVSVSLDDYLDGYTGNIYIAIRHFNCTDLQALCLNDVKVTCVSTGKSYTSTFSATVNPSLNIFSGTGVWSDASKWSKGKVPIVTDDIVINGDATIESGDITVNTLTINDNVSGLLTVNSGVNLTISSFLNNENADALIINDGAQIFLNNSGASATYVMLIDNPASWGNDHKGGWQFISSPVLNADISAFEPESETDYDLFKYDGTQELQWVNYKNHPMDFETKFQSGRGYIVSYEAETSAKLKGTLNSSTYHTFTDMNPIYDSEDRFWNFYLLGNPFTFNMDWANISDISNVYNGYATISNVDGSYDYHTSGTIKVGDGFLIKATGDNPVLTYGSNTRARNKKHESINVIASTIHGSDNAIIHLAGENDNGFNKLDNLNENIAEVYIENYGKRYGIFSFDEDINEVSLGFDAKMPGIHIISIEPEGEFEYITLVDHITGKETDMLNNKYEFNVYSSEEKHDRFTVKFSKKHITENENFVYQSGDELIINAEGQIQIIDIMGRTVYNGEAHENCRINVENLNNATYIIRCVNDENIKTQKIVIH